MPSSRKQMSPKTRVSSIDLHTTFATTIHDWDQYLMIRARLYSTLNTGGAFVPVLTHIRSNNHFPFVEGVFSGMDTQPFIYDKVVEVSTDFASS